MKLLCVRGQAAGLNPDGGPDILSCADSAVQKGGKPFFVPDFMGRITFRAQIALRVCRLGKTIPERFAHRYYDAATLAVTFTAEELRRNLLAEDRSETLATSFDGAINLGGWICKEQLGPQEYWHYSLRRNQQEEQSGAMADLRYGPDEVISYVSRYFTLKTGDVILLGSAGAESEARIDDRLEGELNDRPVIGFSCK